MITIKTGNIQSRSEFGTGIGFPITLKDAAVQSLDIGYFLKNPMARETGKGSRAAWLTI